MQVHVRAFADLVELVDWRELDVPFGRPRSVKDLVESVGLPHPEIGLLLVDGEPVGFDHLLTGGERVSAYPPSHDLVPDARHQLWPTPPDPRRFVLDVHLGTLARRLRLLGFDSWYRNDTDDAELADIARAEGRILLTRDRQLLMRRSVVHGYCPRSDDPEHQVTEVVRRYQLRGRHAPLSRCVPCNGELAPVAKADVAHRLPPRTRQEHDVFVRCDRCDRVYWEGSHVPAIDDILGTFGASRPAPPPRTGS